MSGTDKTVTMTQHALTQSVRLSVWPCVVILQCLAELLEWCCRPELAPVQLTLMQ
jgi:hypothetical protein